MKWVAVGSAACFLIAFTCWFVIRRDREHESEMRAAVAQGILDVQEHNREEAKQARIAELKERRAKLQLLIAQQDAAMKESEKAHRAAIENADKKRGYTLVGMTIAQLKERGATVTGGEDGMYGIGLGGNDVHVVTADASGKIKHEE